MNIVLANEQMLRVNASMGLETDVNGKKFFDVFPISSKGNCAGDMDVFNDGKI